TGASCFNDYCLLGLSTRSQRCAKVADNEQLDRSVHASLSHWGSGSALRSADTAKSVSSAIAFAVRRGRPGSIIGSPFRNIPRPDDLRDPPREAPDSVRNRLPNQAIADSNRCWPRPFRTFVT